MATSRRRERELARRRFERRRQAELERRARAKRRNTITGAVAGTAIVLGLLGWGIVALASSPSHAKAAALSSSPTPSASLPSSPAPAAPTRCAKISPNPPAKGQPTVPDVTGKVPTKLVVKDTKQGQGRAAKAGDSLSVTYIGISCSTGKVFDATYRDGGKPFTVSPLGTAQVIPGWNQGLIGVKAGGVRELVIPASLGYGSQGQGAIKPNETLIFLVTVKSVTPGK